MTHSLSSKHQKSIRNFGFSLIELMVVVAIVAILASIAYPAYTRYIVRTRRVAAEACLSQYANYMERLYTTSLSYTASAVPLLDCNTQNSNYYSFQWVTLTSTAFTGQAIPLGQQATRDTMCGTLTLDQAGTRNASGSAGVAGCW